MLALIVEGKAVGFALGERRDVVPGVCDHKVAVEVGVGEVLAEGFYDGGSDG